MNNEKSLEMSVTIPPPKSAVSRQFYHLIIGALFLIFVFSLIVAGGFYKRESLKNEVLSREIMWQAEVNRILAKDNMEMTDNVFEAFQITSERSRNDVWECVDHPREFLLYLDSQTSVCAPIPNDLGNWNAVFRACLTNIRDRDIGFTRPMVTGYSN